MENYKMNGEGSNLTASNKCVPNEVSNGMVFCTCVLLDIDFNYEIYKILPRYIV